jgi:hypothetical protein
VGFRPAGTLGLVSGIWFARVGISEQPRVDLGVVFCR